MRTAVDYFGLMAYIWVMSGGMPDGDLLSPAERRPVAGRSRTRRRLRVIEGGRPLNAQTRKVLVDDEDAAVA
jgi:hypothetical protein